MVLAPEHPLVPQITTPEQLDAVENVQHAGAARDGDRAAGGGAREDRRLDRGIRDQPGQRQADPDLDRRTMS